MDDLAPRITELLGARPTAWQRRSAPWQPDGPVEGGNDRFTVDLDDGRRVFVKAARSEHLARGLRREAEVYAHLTGSFMPGLVAFEDDDVHPVLVLEDLSDADWEPRWEPARVAAVRAALAELASSTPPPNTRPIREAYPELFGSWARIAADPEPFLSTGMRSRDWLTAALPVLRASADAAPVDGDALIHLDVRSDNLCFRGSQVLLVDWNWSCLSAADFDIACWLPSLALEGGPRPWEVLRSSGGYAALLAGVWAEGVGLPPPATAPTVREMQRRQLEVALAWAEREIGI
jgi:hypothetical protein